MEVEKAKISTKTICVIYARVSTKNQEMAGNLDRQIGRLTIFAFEHQMSISHVIKEVASGMNENRKGIKTLLSIIEKESIQYLLVEYKDRLARIGYNYLETYCHLLSFGRKVPWVATLPQERHTPDITICWRTQTWKRNLKTSKPTALPELKTLPPLLTNRHRRPSSFGIDFKKFIQLKV